MLLVFHFKIRSNKTSNLTQAVKFDIKRYRIDLRWKRLICKLVEENINLFKFDSNARIKTEYGVVECNIGNPKTFSNDLANWILKKRRLHKIKETSIAKNISIEHLSRPKTTNLENKKGINKKPVKRKKQKGNKFRPHLVRG